MSERRFVLVTGATGRAGYAIGRELLARGHGVRAMTRRRFAPAALDLEMRGATVVPGRLDDPRVLSRALDGVDALVAVTTPRFGEHVEVRHGYALAFAARNAGIEQVLYLSFGADVGGSAVRHFDAKARIERMLEGLRLPHTVISSAFFMSNLFDPWIRHQLATGVLRLGLPGTRMLPLVSVESLAGLAAHLVEHPAQCLGERIHAASDVLPGWRIAEVLSAYYDRPIAYDDSAPRRDVGMAKEVRRMLEWYDLSGHLADATAVRARFPHVSWESFERWAGRQDWLAVGATPASKTPAIVRTLSRPAGTRVDLH